MALIVHICNTLQNRKYLSLRTYSSLLTIVIVTYRKSVIFRAINFRVKYILDKQPRTTLALIMRIILVRLIFTLPIATIRKYFNNKHFAIYGRCKILPVLLGQVNLIVSLSSPSVPSFFARPYPFYSRICTELCGNGRHGTRVTQKRQQ